MIPFTLRDPVFLSIINYRPFIIKVNSGVDSQFTIPTNPQTYNVYSYNVRTSDGQSFTGLTGNKEIIFPDANTDYILEISGTFPSWYQANNKEGENLKVLDIMQWGDIKWGLSLSDSFRNCQNLIMSAVDIPNLDITTALYGTFRDTNINPPSMTNWDVSNINTMAFMFYNTPFNQDIGDWDVSKVTSMQGMFFNTPFDQDIGGWDVSNVTNMVELFRLTPFNQDIGGWNVGKVTNMGGMFRNSSAFNQDISSWDVSKAVRMNAMFFGTPFNQDISSWITSSATDMNSMFRDSQFNQDISGWDVDIVTDWTNFRLNCPLTNANTPPKFL